jgi:hypothetical protein
VGVCGESMDTWHPPVVNGCATGHEHGDAPPSWIAAAGYQVLFHSHVNTSPLENTAKHPAMKGFTARFNNVDIYFRVHFASNAPDRSSRYHSYEVFARDPSGGVSHWQLWDNTGDPVADRVPRIQGDPERRPIVLVVDRASWDAGIRCEQWYTAPGQPAWAWDFGWTICNSTTFYQGPGENATPYDMTLWQPTGDLGTLRRLEAAWYGSRAHPTGRFWSTQFGQIANGGPTDPLCSGSTVGLDGKTYQNVCLEQFIAPTMTTVQFPNNATQKRFDATGVHIPN